MQTVQVMLLVALALLSAVPHAAATTYYVSSTAGNDTNAGTSSSAPFLSLARASLAPLAPGDSLLLSRNNSWYGQSLSLDAVSNMTIGSYGAATARRPLIQVPRSSHQHASCVSLTNIGDAVVVENLEIAGCSTGISVSAAAPGARFLTIRNNFFRDIRHPFADFRIAGPAWGSAIELVSGNFNSTYVKNNVGVRMDTFFNANAEKNGLFLDSNTVAQCGGNCVAMTRGTNLHLMNSVFLRDSPDRFFLYGTTDVIIGTIAGNNSIRNSCFNTRGEYMGGPDGCAVDFETGLQGITVSDNYFYKSFGAGIMVFDGHGVTSTGFTITGNVFDQAGCVQPRSDHYGIAFVCPGKQSPVGAVTDNSFNLCPGIPKYYTNPKNPNCLTHLEFADNVDAAVAPPPVINLPPAPTKSASGTATIVATVVSQPNATLRYTVDGSRPTEESPVLPTEGYKFPFPSPGFAFNVRAWVDGMLPSATDGMIVEGGYFLGDPGGPSDNGPTGGFDGSLDGFTLSASAAELSGWAVDTSMAAAGTPPVTVVVSVDAQDVAATVALEVRSDLPPAHVAPNPQHGFHVQLPAEVVALLQTGNHTVSVRGVGSPSCTHGCELPKSPRHTCSGKPC